MLNYNWLFKAISKALLTFAQILKKAHVISLKPVGTIWKTYII